MVTMGQRNERDAEAIQYRKIAPSAEYGEGGGGDSMTRFAHGKKRHVIQPNHLIQMYLLFYKKNAS